MTSRNAENSWSVVRAPPVRSAQTSPRVRSPKDSSMTYAAPACSPTSTMSGTGYPSFEHPPLYLEARRRSRCPGAGRSRPLGTRPPRTAGRRRARTRRRSARGVARPRPPPSRPAASHDARVRWFRDGLEGPAQPPVTPSARSDRHRSGGTPGVSVRPARMPSRWSRRLAVFPQLVPGAARHARAVACPTS